MKIIFCLSYLSVPVTITKAAAGEAFIIVVSKESMYRLFCEIFNKKNIVLIDTQPPILSKSPIKMLENIICVLRNKIKIWKQFRAYRNCEVHYFATAYSEYETWLVKKMATYNKIYFKSIVDIDHLDKKYGFYQIIYLFVNRLIYGIKLVPLWNGRYCFYSIVTNFMKNNNADNNELCVDNRSI